MWIGRSETQGRDVVIKVFLTQDEVGELQAVFKHSPRRAVRNRAQAVLMAAEARPRWQIAQDLCLTPRTLQRWLNLWKKRNRAGVAIEARLQPRKPPGQRPRLKPSLARRIRQWVIKGPAACGLTFANWTHQTLAEHASRELGIRVRRSAMGAFCRRHDIRPYRPTYRYLRGDPAKQAAARVELEGLKKGPMRISSCS